MAKATVSGANGITHGRPVVTAARDYLAGLTTELNRRPPEGAFTVYDVIQRIGAGTDTTPRRESIRDRLLRDVEGGLLESGKFLLNGKRQTFYWPKNKGGK